MSAPTGTLNTQIGPVRYTMTKGDHVHLHTNEVGLTVRGIQYSVGFHCYLIDGVWKARDYRETYASRRDKSFADASPAACKTIGDTLAAAWAECIAEHPDFINAATRDHLEEEINRLVDKVDDVRGTLKSLEAELKEKRKALTTLEQQ